MRSEEDIKQDLEYMAWMGFFNQYYDEDDSADLAGAMINNGFPYIPSRVSMEFSTRVIVDCRGTKTSFKVGLTLYDKMCEEKIWIGYHAEHSGPLLDTASFDKLKQKIMEYRK